MIGWAVVVSRPGIDTVSELDDLVDRLRLAGIVAAGILQRKIPGDDPYQVELRRLTDGETVSLTVTPSTAVDETTTLCDYVFSGEGFQTARQWLQSDSPAAQVVVVDQVGQLETGGRGHHDAIRDLLQHVGPLIIIFSVRAKRLFDVVYRFVPETDPVADLELPVDAGQKDRFVELIGDWLAKQSAAG